MLLLEQVLILRARLNDVGHVDVVEGGEQRGSVLRFLEALGDRLAQAGHLDALLRAARTRRRRGRGGRGGRRRGSGLGGAGGGGGHDVVLGQAAILAGALGLAGVQAMLQHQAAYRRRQGEVAAFAFALIVGGRGRRRSGGRRRGGFGLGGRSGGRGRRRCRGGGAFVHITQQRADFDGVAFLGDDVAHSAGRRRRHVDRDLVGFQADDGFVGGDGLTGLLEPLSDGCFGNGFAQGRDFDFGGHALSQPFFWRRISSRTL